MTLVLSWVTCPKRDAMLLNNTNKNSHILKSIIHDNKCFSDIILPVEQTDDQVPCKLERSSLICFPAVLRHLDPSVTRHSTQENDIHHDAMKIIFIDTCSMPTKIITIFSQWLITKIISITVLFHIRIL